MIAAQQAGYLFKREWMRIRLSVKDTLINYWLIWPVIFGYANGYFMPLAAFGNQSYDKATELVLGTLFLTTIIGCFFNVLEIINERLETKVFQYHVAVMSLRTVFVTRFAFTAAYVFVLVLPFCFVAKLVLGPWLVTSHVAWGHFCAVLTLGVVTTTSYLFCWVGFLKKMSDFKHMWERGVEPIMWLGGAWAPGYAIVKSGVPGMSLITRLNPFIYFSDALRQLFLPGPQFTSLSTCYAVMVISTCVMTLFGYHLLKQRMDLV